MVAAAPVVAVLSAHPDQRGPTFTLRDTTVTYHLDTPPPGVDIHRPVPTDQLLAAAGLDASTLRSAAAAGGTLLARSSPPPGTPTTSTLAQHVMPSCTGVSDGNAGDRVQVAYVTQVGGTDRFASVLPALQSYVADVDDVMGVSAAETGGGRRVRWVTDAACVPTVLHVVLPAGSLGLATDSDGGFTATINAMKALGYNANDHKYLMFVEANNLCGIAQVYPTSAKASNYNNGYAPMFARVDNSCWTSTYHSVAAHELMHTLGSVQSDSGHPSAAGHCTDEYDVMCYVDGTGVTLTYPCPAAHEQLYDCNHDDYFSTDPAPGSYLATHWNTADSGFLDTVPALGATPTLTLSAPASLRPGLAAVVGISDSPPAGSTYVWRTSPAACLASASTAPTVTVMCPANVTSPVTVNVTRTAGGTAELGTATVQPAATGPDPITVALTAPAAVSLGATATASATLSYNGLPVRGTVYWYTAAASGGTWTLMSGPVLTDASGASHVSKALSVAQQFQVVVLLASSGSTWTAAPQIVTVDAVRRYSALTASITAGTPDRVRGHLYTTSGNLAGQRVTLWMHYAGTTTFTAVTTTTTDANGWTYVWVQPKRYAVYRWTYAGSPMYQPSTSPSVVATS